MTVFSDDKHSHDLSVLGNRKNQWLQMKLGNIRKFTTSWLVGLFGVFTAFSAQTGRIMPRRS